MFAHSAVTPFLGRTDGCIWIPYLARYLEIFKKPNFQVVECKPTLSEKCFPRRNWKPKDQVWLQSLVCLPPLEQFWYKLLPYSFKLLPYLLVNLTVKIGLWRNRTSGTNRRLDMYSVTGFWGRFVSNYLVFDIPDVGSNTGFSG